MWMEKYTKKIDRLPLLNVDEELVIFGASIAETFRGMAEAFRSGSVRAGVRISQGYANYTNYGNYYGNQAPVAGRKPPLQQSATRNAGEP